MTFASGGIVGPGGVEKFASGGVVRSPTTFAMGGATGLAGENGSEAILPVVRTPSGKAGVRSSGGGGSTVINIVVEGGSQGETADMELAKKISKEMLKGQKNNSAAQTRQQTRPGNILNGQFTI